MSVHTFEEIRDEAERQGKIIDEQKKAEESSPKPRSRKKTAAEIMNEDMEQMDADVKSMIEEARPKTPLEAAIDRATGFKPEDAVKAIMGTEKPDSETDSADLGTEKPDSETEQGNSETEPVEDETEPIEDETPAKTPAKRDWVKEAYECFVKDAKDIDPTDPVKAIEVYFEKNATDELKARCKAEGKDAEGCWKFIEAIARKALGGSEGHIDPAVVYAIAMHWFEDVPKDWDKPAPSPKPAKAAKPKKKSTKIEKLEQKVAQGQSEPVRQKAKEELCKTKVAKKRKSKTQQGFFFEMLETPVEGGTEK